MHNFMIATILATLMTSPVFAKKEFINHTRLMDHGDGHLMDMDGGMVMGQNLDVLPGGCDKIAAEEEITVHAGHKYSKKFPGTMFAFDQQEYRFEPCTKLTVHFINDDSIRHQWMMHGLPKYLYPKGMFHLEVTGPGEISGTLIFPPKEKTYLVHCDISQHMEKGMKAQIKIGKGSGDLPSIPGVSAFVVQDDYSDSIPIQPTSSKVSASKKVQPSTTGKAPASGQSNSGLGVMIVGFAVGLLLTPFLLHKFKGMSASEVISSLFEMLAQLIGFVIQLITSLITKLGGKKNIELPKE